MTDPPYGLKSTTKITRRGGKDRRQTQAKFAWDRPADYAWIAECFRVLRAGGVFISFYDRERIYEVIQAAKASGGVVRDIGAWHKTNPVPQVRRVKWDSALELFAIVVKGTERHTFNSLYGYHHKRDRVADLRRQGPHRAPDAETAFGDSADDAVLE